MNMNINSIKSVYFIGAGGIGMSALVRYFLSKGKKVAGYDRTPSELTEKLIEEGAYIHYEENTNLIPAECKSKEDTLVVYTPAIPQEHKELVYFRENSETCTGIGNDYANRERFVRSRYTRKDNYIYHGCAPAASVTRGMQCLFGRYIKEL